MKKTATVRQHARKRAKQRFGVDLSREQIKSVIDDIQSSNAIFAGHNDNGDVTYWYVMTEWSESPVPVVYSNQRKEVITFLPEFKEKDRFFTTGGAQK